MKCCNNCRTPYVCGNRWCWCHAFTVDDDGLRGTTSYPDPTGNTAVSNLSRKKTRRNRRQK